MLSDITDPRALTDEELDQLRRDVLDEQERRQKLADLPEALAAMTRDAIVAGCDREQLRARVDEALDAVTA